MRTLLLLPFLRPPNLGHCHSLSSHVPRILSHPPPPPPLRYRKEEEEKHSHQLVRCSLLLLPLSRSADRCHNCCRCSHHQDRRNHSRLLLRLQRAAALLLRSHCHRCLHLQRSYLRLIVHYFRRHWEEEDRNLHFRRTRLLDHFQRPAHHRVPFPRFAHRRHHRRRSLRRK